MTDSTDAPVVAEGQPAGRRLFRRRSTIIAGFVFAGILAFAGIAFTPGEIGHGFLSALAPLLTTLPIALITLIFIVYPHVVVHDQRLDVNNSFVSYQVPYKAIDDLRQNRMGLIVRTVAGKTIPATAYTSGSAGRMMNHKEQADEVIQVVQNAMEFKRAKPDEDLPAVRRTLNVRNIVFVVVALAVIVGIIVGAANTYH